MKKIAVKVKNEKQAKVVVDYFNEVGNHKYKELFKCEKIYTTILFNETKYGYNWEYDSDENYVEKIGYNIISFSKFKEKYINKYVRIVAGKDEEYVLNNNLKISWAYRCDYISNDYSLLEVIKNGKILEGFYIGEGYHSIKSVNKRLKYYGAKVVEK